jgi:hypothetical protein
MVPFLNPVGARANAQPIRGVQRAREVPVPVAGKEGSPNDGREPELRGVHVAIKGIDQVHGSNFGLEPHLLGCWRMSFNLIFCYTPLR